MTDQFKDKVVLVTGSSTGIGEAIALAFARQGALLTIHGRNVETLAKVAEKIVAISGHEPVQVIGEMLDDGTTKRIIDGTVARYGRLDVLVNNAGMGGFPDHIEAPNFMETFDSLIRVNLRSAVEMIHLAVPLLEKSRGNIVNISSIASKKCIFPSYCASKAALDSITKCVALQLAPKGIRVNSVNPGPVQTDFCRAFGAATDEASHQMFRDKVSKVTPLRICAVADDIAPLVLFLADDRVARNMTGSNVITDTGTMLDPATLGRLDVYPEK